MLAYKKRNSRGRLAVTGQDGSPVTTHFQGFESKLANSSDGEVNWQMAGARLVGVSGQWRLMND